MRGEGGRYRFIGRERAYHGVGFGGISVGGILPNRRTFGPMLPGVDHLPATYNREQQAFSKGQPEWGAHLADDLERLVNLHDASTIAAVIVEPVSGSAGVLVPPKGYLKVWWLRGRQAESLVSPCAADLFPISPLAHPPHPNQHHSGCARSATSTGCCSSLTRSSRASGAWARDSAPSTSTWSPT